MQIPGEQTLLAQNVRRWLVFAVAGFIPLYAAWLVWGRPDVWERVILGGMTMVFTSSCAALLAMWVRFGSQERRMRRAWNWLSAGLILWAVADLVRLLLQLNPSQFLQMVDVPGEIYMVGSIPVWAGLMLYPHNPRERTGRLALFFDLALVTIAAVTLIWLLIFQPALAANRNTSSLLAFLYPSSDLITLILLVNLFLLADAQRFPVSLGWVLAGLLVTTMSDLIYTSRLLNTGYQSGSLMDMGWVLGDFLLAFGAIGQLKREPINEKLAVLLRRLLSSFQSLLPLIITLILGWYTLLVWQLNGKLEILAVWVTVSLAIGLTARQGILAGEMELEKYANLVNSVAEPAFVCDRHGRLQLVNPALLRATGFLTPDDLLSKPLEQLISPGQEIALALQAGFAGGWSGELVLNSKDRTFIPISLSLRPLRPGSDSRLALAGTAHDLSEQKQQQAALQAAYEQIAADRAQLEELNLSLEQKVAEKTVDLTQALEQLEQQNLALQKLDQLKSDFVSMVSHELLAPLTNINSGIELLLSRSEPMPCRAQQNLTLVRSEIQRLSRFVESILDLSALDAGKLPLYPAPILLESIAAQFQQQAASRPELERVCWNIPTDLPPLLTDEQAISSILFHLIDNGLKYAPEGQIQIVSEEKDGRIWVNVEDRGPGLPEETIPLLFDRFYRLDTTDARTVYGRGLGLYIVKRLVTAMQGDVFAANRPGGGAIFTFWLPKA
jgi:PAS domain S-box-containing protein